MTSIESKKLENKLLSVNINDIESFIQIMNDLTDADKKILGDKLEIWKISCLYHFLLSPNFNTNLFNNAPQIIKKFKELEATIINNKSNKDSIRMMYAGTGDEKYLQYLKKDIMNLV